jgi:hypothetical protein
VTALCGGGTSGPKPNTAVDVILTATQLASFLTSKVGLWAALVSGTLGVLTFETGIFCSSDPPAQPTITADEYNALLQLGPPELFQSALSKLRDLVLIAMWYELCACTSVTTPQPPANLYAPPTGVGVQDYTTTPCANPRSRFTFYPNWQTYDDASNVTRALFPNFEFTRSPGTTSQYPPTDIAPIPASWTGVYSVGELVSGGGPANFGYGINLLTYNDQKIPGLTRGDVSVDTVTPVRRNPSSGFDAFDKTVQRYFSVHQVSGSSSAPGGVVDAQFFFECSGQSAASITCGTDPVLQALLNQLLELCQRTREDVTLLQRYALPFAYVRGPTSSGLTGTGSMALGRSVGLLIDVLGFPAANKQMLGEPPYIFDLGWVSALTPDGLVDEIRLTREHTTWLSKLIPSAELVGWGLRDGVQIRVTELHAEP